MKSIQFATPYCSRVVLSRWGYDLKSVVYNIIYIYLFIYPFPEVVNKQSQFTTCYSHKMVAINTTRY